MVAALSALVADLQNDGFAVSTAVVPTGSGRRPEKLEEIVRVHALMHAAEGHFYRDVVAAACEAVGLSVTRTPERELRAAAAARLEIDEAGLDEQLKAMGARLGARLGPRTRSWRSWRGGWRWREPRVCRRGFCR